WLPDTSGKLPVRQFIGPSCYGCPPLELGPVPRPRFDYVAEVRHCVPHIAIPHIKRGEPEPHRIRRAEVRDDPAPDQRPPDGVAFGMDQAHMPAALPPVSPRHLLE